MKLRHFLDAAYAVLHEEYQRYKLNLFEATAQLREYTAGYGPKDAEGKPVSAAADREARENQRAYAELQQLMKSTGIVLP